MAKVQEIGPYSAYAIAVKYGYKGTEEEWVKEQEANRKAAEAAAAAAAQSAKDADASASGVAQSGQQAVQSIKDAQTAAEQAIDTAKQQAVQAAQAEAEKAATSAGQAASSAAEAAQSATNAAAEVGKVQSAGTSAVQAVQAAQNTATEAVSAAQQTATQTVSEAQATAVSAVQEAGTTQTGTVESAGTAAVSAVSNAKTEALSQISTAGTAQVSAVGTAGTSAVQDVNDAKTAALGEIDAANAALPVPTVSDAGKVPTVNDAGTGYVLGKAQVDAYTKAESDARYAPIAAAIRPTASGNPVSITDSVEWPLQGLKVYGKSVQDGTPSPENPVPIVSAGDGGSVELAITGKNLLTGRLYYGGYSNGYAYIRKETAVSLPYVPFREEAGICQTVSVKKGKTYTFSVTNPNTNAQLLLALYKTFEDTSDYQKAISKVEGGLTQSITPSEDGILVCLIAGKWTDGTTTIHECTASELLQLEVGSTATAYEAPHSQSITATTPNGLPGIPVDSGGNFTDAEGQQWVCDEVDFARGVYVQRVKKFVLTDNENVSSMNRYVTDGLNTVQPFRVESWMGIIRKRTNLLSENIKCQESSWNSPLEIAWTVDATVDFNIANERLGTSADSTSEEACAALKAWLVSNPLTFLCQLVDPIETPLSEEEIAAYRALHTYDGTTVISTPEDVAGLEVRYVADAQKYIDDRLAAAESHIQEIAAAQLNAQTGG